MNSQSSSGSNFVTLAHVLDVIQKRRDNQPATLGSSQHSTHAIFQTKFGVNATVAMQEFIAAVETLPEEKQREIYETVYMDSKEAFTVGQIFGVRLP